MIKYEDKYIEFDRKKKIGVKYFVRKCIYIAKRMYYSILFRILKPAELKNVKYKVSVCAIFKDEADYLMEWIEFHKIIGVDHFYLYNNNSTDHYLDILTPYIEENIVTLIDWPIPHSQRLAYQDCMDKFSAETQWIGFIDLDEYVVPNKHDTIYDFLKDFNNRPAVVIYWKCFGTSGLLNRDPNGIIVEDFVLGRKKYIDIGKFFFNTKYTYPSSDTDRIHFIWGISKGVKLPPVNVFDKVCTYEFNPVKTDDMPIQINHYLIKSYDEYIKKKSIRGGGVHGVGMHDSDYFYRNELKSIKADYHAYKYLIKLKLALAEKKAT